jgi:hypothetical protein
MPEQFHREWRNWEAPDLRSEDQTYFICDGLSCPEPAPEELFSVTAYGVETTNTRCAVTRVAKFDTCPWGRLSKRPSQRNPWGPGYNIKLQCKEKNGRTFNLVRDWVREKGTLRLNARSRISLPIPTPDETRLALIRPLVSDTANRVSNLRAGSYRRTNNGDAQS